MMPLGLLGEGEAGEIVAVAGTAGDCAARAEEMGLRVGKRVLMLTNGAGPVLVEDEEAADSPLKTALRGAFTPLTALGFMFFVLLYMPCVVAAAAMRQEFGGWKWFGVAFLYQTGLAWGMALIVHQVGRLLGWGA